MDRSGSIVLSQGALDFVAGTEEEEDVAELPQPVEEPSTNPKLSPQGTRAVKSSSLELHGVDRDTDADVHGAAVEIATGNTVDTADASVVPVSAAPFRAASYRSYESFEEELVEPADDDAVVMSTDRLHGGQLEHSDNGARAVDPVAAEMADEENCLTDNPWVKCCCTPGAFVFFICIYSLIQSMVVTGLFSSTLSTVQKRYALSTSTMGTISSTYDITYLVLAGGVSYYGASVRGHTPRWLGSGLILLGVGTFMYSLPQFVGSQYKYNDQALSTDFCQTSPYAPDCRDDDTGLLWLFFLAQIVIATGASPLYTLVPAYLDEVVPKLDLPMYLAYFYACSALGPAIGFLLAFVFLDTWVDPDNSPRFIKQEDPGWVGAWWTGYMVAFVAAIIMGIPLLMYPKYLPKSRYVREQNKIESTILRRRLSTAAPLPAQATWTASLKAILVTPTYMFNVFGSATESFSVAGFSAFLPKIVESLFGLSSSASALAVGFVIIPGAAGGMIFGGWLMKRLQLRAVQTAKLTWIIALISLLFMPGFYIGCDTIVLAGVTEPYAINSAATQFRGGGNGDYHNLSATCNAGCVCDPDIYTPVCANGVNYFSACYAGCVNRTDSGPDASYSGCGCVDSSGLAAVENGKCDTGCSALPIFLVMLFFIMFFTFMNNVPGTAVQLRSLQPQHRSLGTGIQNVVFRVFGTIPAPIIFGALIDQTCTFHETNCGDKTENCWEYQATDLRVLMVLLAVIPKILSFILFFLSWYFFRSVAEPANRGGAAARKGMSTGVSGSNITITAEASSL